MDVNPDRTGLVLRVLNSRVRREILWRVWNDELAVATIAAGFELSAPTISEHLAVLRDADLVRMRSEGTTRWYSANRPALASFRALLDSEPGKWETTTDHVEQQVTVLELGTSVVIRADATCDQRTAFRAFTDPEIYTRWLGAPVSIEEGRFAAEMEFGTSVRGIYELVAEPALIAMAWDFEHDGIPAPGSTTRAILLFLPVAEGCRLELTQIVATADQAPFMAQAWRLILGRFVGNIEQALDPSAPAVAHPKRPRRSLGGARGGAGVV